jgi:hypothetical protein
MSSRLPTILGKAVDDAVTTLNTESLEERVVDLAQCIDRMGELMADPMRNCAPSLTMVKRKSPFGTKPLQSTSKVVLGVSIT